MNWQRRLISTIHHTTWQNHGQTTLTKGKLVVTFIIVIKHKVLHNHTRLERLWTFAYSSVKNCLTKNPGLHDGFVIVSGPCALPSPTNGLQTRCQSHKLGCLTSSCSSRKVGWKYWRVSASLLCQHFESYILKWDWCDWCETISVHGKHWMMAWLKSMSIATQVLLIEWNHMKHWDRMVYCRKHWQRKVYCKEHRVYCNASVART